jgi:hypothetical protein
MEARQAGPWQASLPKSGPRADGAERIQTTTIYHIPPSRRTIPPEFPLSF